MRSWRDVGRVELLEFVDITKDRIEVASKFADFILAQIKTREKGDVANRIWRDFFHSRGNLLFFLILGWRGTLTFSCGGKGWPFLDLLHPGKFGNDLLLPYLTAKLD